MTDQGAVEKAHRWSVPPDLQGIRLDAFLRRCLPQLSRRVLEVAIAERLFRINAKVGRKGEALREADVVTYHGDAAWLAVRPLPDADLPVPIVYEDDFLLVLDKPAGMATHGFSARDRGTLANFLSARYPELASVHAKPWEFGVAHRLDRETSGLVLVAKSAEVFAQLRRQFQQRQISKWYWALVWGETPKEGSINLPIAHDSADKRKMRALAKRGGHRKNLKSWQAATHYYRLGERQGTSLLELEMFTGVTHQLRVHLAAIGHPIVGDSLYGADYSERFGLQRHFLHAQRLQLHHPQTARVVEFVAPLPAELSSLLENLQVS